MKLFVIVLPFFIALMPLAFVACGDGPDKPLAVPATLTRVVQASPEPTQSTAAPQDFDPVTICTRTSEENFQVTIEFDKPVVTIDGHVVLGFLLGPADPGGAWMNFAGHTKAFWGLSQRSWLTVSPGQVNKCRI